VVAAGVYTGGGLVACSSTPSQKLVERTEPLRAVWVVCWLGPYAGAGARGQEVRAAMRERFPALLARNGLAVTGYVETAKPLRSLDELNELWKRRPEMSPPPSHVLVITAQHSIQTAVVSPGWDNGVGGTIEHEAVLWEPARNRLVWKAGPKARTSVASARVDELASNVLTALQRDDLLAMPAGAPTNLEGKSIR